MRATPHPEVQRVLEIFDELKVPDFYKTSPEEARALFRSLRPEEDVLPKIHYTKDHIVNLNGADILLREYRPNDDKNLPVLVWYHGGGWVFGDTASGELACRELATQANCAVVSVDYRLAPEHPFPTPLNDCIAATQWVKDNAEQLSVDVSRIAIGGDSAGGNLAASVAQHGRDNGESYVHQLLIYPVTQPDFSQKSYIDNAEGYFLSTASMQWFWDHYLPDAHQRKDPKASPLNGNLQDLPSAWIFTCGLDPLCDDGSLYAAALDSAGVAMEVYHQNNAIHGVFGMMVEPGAIARAAGALSLRSAFSRAE